MYVAVGRGGPDAETCCEAGVGVAAAQVGQDEQGLSAVGQATPPRADAAAVTCEKTREVAQGAAGRTDGGRVERHTKAPGGLVILVMDPPTRSASMSAAKATVQPPVRLETAQHLSTIASKCYETIRYRKMRPGRHALCRVTCMTQQSQEMPTCFVVSPIGSEDSDVRMAADDFLELLLEPVLSSYRFKVVRADRMATPTAITTDVIRLVQEAELCIIDLTGHNANVFYECGRRHETGRPFIQMVSKSWEERLPFDVAGIRTLTYDLSNARAVLASQNALRVFIDAIASGEVDQRSTGASMSTVSQSLQRIERKLDTLTSNRGRALSAVGARDNLDLLIMSPRDAWFSCMRSGDLAGAMAQMDRLKRAVPLKEYLGAVCILLAAGHEETFPRLENEINKLVDSANAGELDDQGGAPSLPQRLGFGNFL